MPAWIPVGLLSLLLAIALVATLFRQRRRIADLQSMAHSLRRAENRLRFALNADRVIAWEWNCATGESWTTTRVETWLGLPIGTLDGKWGWLEAVHPVDRERIQQAMADSAQMQGESDVEHRLICRDGRVKWVHIHARRVLSADGGPTDWFTGILLDVTADRENREQLRLLESAVLHAHEAIVVLGERLSPEKPVRPARFVNEAFCRMTGYTREELLGDSLHRLRGPETSASTLQHLHEALETDTPFATELLNYRKDGTAYWVELSLVPLPPRKSEPAQWVMIQRDITERRHLEEHLHQATRLEAIGQMAGGVAHDFNNLMTAALGNLALIQFEPDDPNRPLLKAAELAAKRAADLTRQLLGYAGRNQVMIAPTDPGDVLNEAVSLLQHTLGAAIHVQVEVEAECGAALADATLLNQAVINLCLNARDAMPTGGTLTLSAGSVHLTDADRSRHPDGEAGAFIRISVRDTGTGIPDHAIPRLFEPFFTTKPPGQGTGLGLSMVQGIVKQHNGWIECHSEVGQGTCFDLYLPQADRPPTTLPRPVHRALPPTLLESGVTAVPAQRLRSVEPPAPTNAVAPSAVMLVDDEAMIRELGKVILERAGFSVLTAEDGRAAVDLFAREHQRVGLVILDVTMPRMSGRDAYREMRRIAPDAKILFSTGYSADGITELERSMGLLSKPYRPNEMLAVVREAMSRTMPIAD